MKCPKCGRHRFFGLGRPALAAYGTVFLFEKGKNQEDGEKQE
jgi:hypothetical protein